MKDKYTVPVSVLSLKTLNKKTANMATERLNTPLLFPCAARVKIPQLGSDDSDIKLEKKSSSYAPTSIVFRTSNPTMEPLSREYLKKVSTDLSFAEEVVKERCFHALPYDEKYLAEAFNIDGLVSLPTKTSMPVGRHNSRGGDIRHMPCNLTVSTKPHLKPLRRKIVERAQHMHLEALKREELKLKLHGDADKKYISVDETDEVETDEEPSTSVFLTETKDYSPTKTDAAKIPNAPEVKFNDTEAVIQPESKTVVALSETAIEESGPKRSNDWDAYLMSMLSTNTANWIVYEKTPAGSKDQQKLSTLLKKWYGEPEHTDLIRDDISDTEAEQEEKEKKKPKKKWKKKEATLLEKVYHLEDAPAHSRDPYSDDNQAPFYRQPAGLRRARKHEEKEEMGAINTTAANVKVKTFQPSPPPTLMDFINPEVGDKVIQTNNIFQMEKLTGTEQVFEAFGDKTRIVMESNNRYKKQLQPQFPESPESWYPETEGEKAARVADARKQRKQEHGHKRWKTLPEPIDDTAELLKVLPPGYDEILEKSADPRTRKTAKGNASLMQIIDEWRTKWHLSGQYTDSSPDDLIKDMADIQSHVRLKAIATCAKASEYRPPTSEGIRLDYMDNESRLALPEKLFVALECLLDDHVEKVQKAAAITLYSLNRPCDKATEILHSALHSESPVDRWAAAQCLAHYGICDSDVIGELLTQVMTTEDTIKHERGIGMLGILSVTSNLVHSMVAEQLNSSSWRHKVISCKILPTLKGDINKDITNKLSDLMWNDWHAEVRRAAGQCLGKTGHGKDVHDDLRMRISDGSERIQLEAINKVGQLGIMTAKLLPSFLKCFGAEYVAVRAEVCITCGNLAIKDEEVIGKLLHLATFDNIWKVKALAFQALGKIGVVTEQITDCLLWAVRYEGRPGVRAEACHTIKELRILTEVVADVLQDRCLVESSQMVRDEISSALEMFDISTTEDMDMVAQVKKEVQRLSTRNIIASQITLNEQDADHRDHMKRMIYQSEDALKKQRKHLQSLRKASIDPTTVIPRRHIHHSHLSQCPSKFMTERKRDISSFEVFELKKAHDTQQISVMQRLRTISGAGSRKSKPTSSVPTTPDAGRDIMVFTPTAEQELEAIMSKYDAVSSCGEESVTPRPKSTATSESSRGTGTDMEDEDDSKEGLETPRECTSSRLGSRGTLRSDGDIDDEQKSGERPTSMVRFSSHLQVADIPRSSDSRLASSQLSMLDDEGQPIKSRASTPGTNGLAFGREAIAEREKINVEARNTFAVMDMRYRDMVEDLIDLDNTFELGLTSGSRQDFERKIQSVRIIQTPPSRPQDPPRIELTVDEVEPVEGEEEEIDDTGNQSVSGNETQDQSTLGDRLVDKSTCGNVKLDQYTAGVKPVNQSRSDENNVINQCRSNKANVGQSIEEQNDVQSKVTDPGIFVENQSVEASSDISPMGEQIVNMETAAQSVDPVTSMSAASIDGGV